MFVHFGVNGKTTVIDGWYSENWKYFCVEQYSKDEQKEILLLKINRKKIFSSHDFF